MNIKDCSHIHFTGIKGVGMTALALCAQDLGIKITGSDVDEDFITDETLNLRGIKWSIEFGIKNLEPRPDLVITTGAHGGLNNPEVLAAKELGIPVMTHAEALAEFTKSKKTIAVCGVGGKTTTCAMIATILEHAGLNPSYAIGVSDIPSLPAPGKYSKNGEYFIVEADEYAISPGVDNRPRFSVLDPFAVILTNLEHDHPDIYPTFEETMEAFVNFVMKIPDDGLLLVNNTKNNMQLLKNIHKNVVFMHGTYGEKGWQEIWKVKFNQEKTEFVIRTDTISEEYINITLNVPGRFNVYNATAAFLIADWLGIKHEIIVSGLLKYTGCKRRFEKIAEIDDILIYDDYAHHPSEIAATLKAAREWFPERRILVYFQPHTFSRTKNLLKEFGQSFKDADIIYIDEIFASAREQKDESINSEILVQEIKKNQSNPENVSFVTQDNIINVLKDNLKSGDVFITMGAGNVYKTGKLLAGNLSS